MKTHMWMIYGATGYTGKLLVEEAVARGHKPILAGRSEAKLKPLAAQHGLTYMAFELDNPHYVAEQINKSGTTLVLHAAGPFTHTCAPMLTACLDNGVHYLDITGEINVFEYVFTHDSAAKQKNIVLLPGVGFDIVPSDCLGRYVAEQLPDATELEIVISALSPNKDDFGMSAGTLKSFLEMLPRGNQIRRGGKLLPVDFGTHTTSVHVNGRTLQAIAIPWGDVSTAYRTTGIPNITAYMTLPPSQIRLMKLFGTPLRWMMKSQMIRQWAGRQIDRRITGPSEHTRQTARSYIVARAKNATGEQVEAQLETLEGYQFTKLAAIRAVERVLDGKFSGALTPAGAFGADFVLEIEGTTRSESSQLN
ncbi:MAG: saccharopine dehydrogenase [Phototrophicales bacterium]|nr:MAG: saccharopine dehydrogenase [Phototrophicales bacterium]